jgi:hypothetical protein
MGCVVYKRERMRLWMSRFIATFGSRGHPPHQLKAHEAAFKLDAQHSTVAV